MAIHLIQQYYRCPDTARQEEIAVCLRHNLENPWVNTVHLLTEEAFDFGAFPDREKIRQFEIGRRLSFEGAFRYANAQDAAGKHIWILSNADIWFDASLQVLAGISLATAVFALSRHEAQADGSARLMPAEYAHGSQDAWIFQTPVPLAGIYADYCLGTPGCDNRIAYEFVKAGFVVTNPALRIIAHHLDLTRGTDIRARLMACERLNTEANIMAGKITPPPYQYHLYPTDELVTGPASGCRLYSKSLLDLTELHGKLIGLYRELSDRDRRINAHELQVHDLARQLAEHKQQLAERGQQLVELNRQFAEHKQRLAELNRQLAGYEQQLAERDRQLAERNQQLARRDIYITNLLTSSSWRITAPLRWLRRAINRTIRK